MVQTHQDYRPEVQSGSEPILSTGLTVSGAIGATVLVLESFGVDVAPNQESAFVAFFALVLLPIITWAVARRKTVTVAAAREAVQDAAKSGVAPRVRVGS